MKYLFAGMVAGIPFYAAASSFTAFDVPGFTTTCGTAISSTGVVAGVASDSSLKSSKAFLLENGRFRFPRPAVPAGEIYFMGVNRSRTLVGFDLESATVGTVDFIYHAGQTSEPGAGVVGLDAINDNGTLLGSETVAKPGDSFPEVLAFLQNRAGAVTQLDDGTGFMQPRAMDSHAARVVGTSLGSAGLVAWSYFKGVFTPVAVPGATVATSPSAVDDSGRIAGTFYTGTVQAPVAQGFLLRNGIYTVWDVPGALNTQIMGANKVGQITGCYSDGTGTHGFVAVP